MKREPIKHSQITHINNDNNGNPRMVIHYLEFIPLKDLYTLNGTYEKAVYISKAIGGKKHHTKKYGGGIVFSSYSENDLIKRVYECMIIADNK